MNRIIVTPLAYAQLGGKFRISPASNQNKLLPVRSVWQCDCGNSEFELWSEAIVCPVCCNEVLGWFDQ